MVSCITWTRRSPWRGGFQVRLRAALVTVQIVHVLTIDLVGVQLIPVGLLTLMIPFLKESPLWLVKKGREAEAYRVYSFIRNLPADHQYIAEEVSFIKAQVENEREVSANGKTGFLALLKAATKESFTKGIRNRFALVFLMFMWQAWSGAAAINYCEHPSNLPKSPWVTALWN